MSNSLTSQRPGDGQTLVLVLLGYMYLFFTVAVLCERSPGVAAICAPLSGLAFVGTRAGRIQLAARILSYAVIVGLVAFGVWGPPLIDWRSR